MKPPGFTVSGAYAKQLNPHKRLAPLSASDKTTSQLGFSLKSSAEVCNEGQNDPAGAH
jgi:hypothetical protein